MSVISLCFLLYSLAKGFFISLSTLCQSRNFFFLLLTLTIPLNIKAMMYYDVKNQYYGISNLSFCKSLVGKVSYLIEIIISETDNNKYLHTVNNLDLKHIKSFYEKLNDAEEILENKISIFKDNDCSFNNYQCSTIEEKFKNLGEKEGNDLIRMIIENYDEKILKNKENKDIDKMIFRCLDQADIKTDEFKW